MTQIKERVAVITAKADELELANKNENAKAKAEKRKYEPIHAPSVIYKLRRDVDALLLMAYAGLESKLSGEKDEAVKKDMLEKLERFTDPSIGTHISVKKGDKITDVLSANKDIKDVAAKLQAYCEKNGLTVNFAKNIIE
jgi:hypothetical protein